jgi:hypothetical protein
MRDTMAGKPARDFTRISTLVVLMSLNSDLLTMDRKRPQASRQIAPELRFGYVVKGLGLFLLILVLNACTPEMTDDPIPYFPFTPIAINLNLPEYQALKTSGFVYVDGGVRGIIIYRANATTYIAYERNCSFQPNEACATIEMHVSNLYMYDPCCNSTFDVLTGEPEGGPAWRPLRQYETILSGTELTITDDIVE